MAGAANGKPTLKLDIGQQMAPPSSTDAVPAATPSAETPRSILKIRTGSRQASFSGDLPTPSGEKKTIKIKMASQPSTPAAGVPAARTPTVTKAGRSSKPTAKLIESKKRGYDSDEDRPLAERLDSARPQKMIKIKSTKSPSTPHADVRTPITGIKFRPKGEPVRHVPGEAYDSEASDREDDPVRENIMVLRMCSDAATDYLNKALEAGTIGLPRTNGGADFSVQILDAKERRAMVTVDGHFYAAIVVDLPTITEAMKSWDRKNMMKNSDVTQMVLCFAEVRNEIEAKNKPLPDMVDKTEFKWPHGLTPPMHDAMQRRFRKTLTERQFADAAAQVTKHLDDDARALESSWEWIGDDDGDADYDDEDEDADADADGELIEDGDDYFGPQATEETGGEVDEAQLEAEFFESDMMDDGQEGATPATQMEAQTPATTGAMTPAVPQAEVSEEDEDVSDADDDDDDDDDDVDEDKRAADQERKAALEDLEELEQKLSAAEADLRNQNNPILIRRIQGRIEPLKKEIAIKRAALGLVDDDGEE